MRNLKQQLNKKRYIETYVHCCTHVNAQEEPEEPDSAPVPKKQKRTKKQDQSNDDSTTPTVEQAAEPVVDKSEKV